MSQKRFATSILILGDVVALYLALGATLFIRYGTEFISKPWILHRFPYGIIFVIWILFFFIAGLYEQSAWSADRTIKERILRTITAAGITAGLLFYFIPAFVITPKINLLLHILLSSICILGWRIAASMLIRSTARTYILFFGISDEVISLAHILVDHPHIGFRVAGLVHTDTSSQTMHTVENISVLPLNHNLLSFIKEKNVTLAVASEKLHSDKELVRILYNILPLGVQFMDFPTFYENLTGKIPVSRISEVWFLENLAGSRKRVYEFAKRLFDILLGLLVGIGALILFPLIALGIFLSTPRDIWHHHERRARPGDGIIFFRQQRIGKNGKPFYFIKFRSQILGSEQMGFTKDVESMYDPRRYTFGTFLRAFYLDELPQVWNVLKGEMSFIGPRPERPLYVEELAKTIPFYSIRLLVPPGITGWAQINMKNDASVEDAPEKLQYDLYYIKNRSFALDLNIALKTIWVILSREGR
ncbi:MAG: sugar transferase [Parcubacteria group bacterium Gr01-1014_70]|nr:MAG: sugar transferase [Parcubacteria group bacterium Gr01-1014_70]